MKLKYNKEHFFSENYHAAYSKGLDLLHLLSFVGILKCLPLPFFFLSQGCLAALLAAESGDPLNGEVNAYFINRFTLPYFCATSK